MNTDIKEKEQNSKSIGAYRTAINNDIYSSISSVNTCTTTANGFLHLASENSGTALNNTRVINTHACTTGGEFSDYSIVSENTIEELVNPNELIIDVVEKIVKVFDFFSNKLSEYKLNKFFSFKKNNQEFNGISIERDFQPGELKQFVEYTKKEVLIEIDDNVSEDRYGSMYVVRPATLYYGRTYGRTNLTQIVWEGGNLANQDYIYYDHNSTLRSDRIADVINQPGSGQFTTGFDPINIPVTYTYANSATIGLC